MSLGTSKSLAAGTHVWFALEGATLSDAGNVIKPSGDSSSYTAVADTAKPSASDTAWVKLSGVAKAEIGIENGQGIEIWEPVPGGVELTEILRVKRKRSLKITCQRTQPLTWQLLLSTLALNGSSTQFNPAAVPQEVNGWIKIQFYDHKHNLVGKLEAWVELVLSANVTLDPGAKVDPEYTGIILYRELNTGTF